MIESVRPASNFSGGGGLLRVMDEGGIVMEPTLAALAVNAKPEAVIPLNLLGSMMQGRGGSQVYMDFRGSQLMSDRDIEELWSKLEGRLMTLLPGAGVQVLR